MRELPESGKAGIPQAQQAKRPEESEMTHQEIAEQLEVLREKHWAEKNALDVTHSRERSAVAARCGELGHIYVRNPMSYALLSCGVCGAYKEIAQPVMQVADGLVILSQAAIKQPS